MTTASDTHTWELNIWCLISELRQPIPKPLLLITSIITCQNSKAIRSAKTCLNSGKFNDWGILTHYSYQNQTTGKKCSASVEKALKVLTKPLKCISFYTCGWSTFYHLQNTHEQKINLSKFLFLVQIHILLLFKK